MKFEKSIKSVKKRKRQSLATIIAVCIAAVLMVPGLTSPQCLLQQNGYIFFHPIFSTTHWSSSDQLSITIPAALCNSDPVHVKIAGTAAHAVGVLVSGSGNVSLSTFRYEVSPSCFCCKPELIVDEPVSVPLEFAVEHAPAASMKDDTLHVVSIVFPLSISHVALDERGTVFFTDTITVQSANSSQTIEVVSFGTQQRGIWVGGGGGLLRFIPLSGLSWNSEIIFDISQSETITVVSDSFAAAKNGALFVRSNGSFTSNEVLNMSIETGCSSWVAGAGKVALRKEGWRVYADVPELVNANVIYSGEGLVLEWVDKSWNYHRKVLEDSPTSLGSITPASLEQSGVYYYHSDMQETLMVYFQDPDSNIQLPELTIESNWNSVSLYDGIPFTLHGMSMDAFCEIGSARLLSDWIRIVLRPDSIFWDARFAVGTIDFTCGYCFETERILRHGQAWFTADNKFTLVCGADTLTVYKSGSVGSGVRLIPERNQVSFALMKGNLLCRLGKETPAGTITLFSLTGKRLQRYAFKKGESLISLQLPNVTQSVLVLLEFNDGKRLKRIVPYLR